MLAPQLGQLCTLEAKKLDAIARKEAIRVGSAAAAKAKGGTKGQYEGKTVERSEVPRRRRAAKVSSLRCLPCAPRAVPPMLRSEAQPANATTSLGSAPLLGLSRSPPGPCSRKPARTTCSSRLPCPM